MLYKIAKRLLPGPNGGSMGEGPIEGSAVVPYEKKLPVAKKGGALVSAGKQGRKNLPTTPGQIIIEDPTLAAKAKGAKKGTSLIAITEAETPNLPVPASQARATYQRGSGVGRVEVVRRARAAAAEAERGLLERLGKGGRYALYGAGGLAAAGLGYGAYHYLSGRKRRK